MSEFRRIEKYIVINKNDVMDYLNEREFAGLELALSAIRHGRRDEVKKKKNYVCVSDKDTEKFELAWSIIDGTHANLVEENQRLTADMKVAIGLMSSSWQHAASKEPDLMTRYVTMAENQFKKKDEEIERLTAIATKNATRAGELYEALESLINAVKNNTGNEPSLSCYHKAIDDAVDTLNKSRIEAESGDGICN